jgi:eukaryotic-like serine/threonine-protein kinase
VSFPPATVIAGRYELLELLGSGAMGSVWKARDTKFSSRVVAVKLLRDDESLRQDGYARERFVQSLREEVRLHGALSQTFLASSLDEHLHGSADRCRERVAATWGARSPVLDQAVALFDELVNDPSFSESARRRAKQRKLFREEANSVANLRHDNIVSISDTGEHDGVPFLAMDYIDGQTLARVIQRQEPLSRIRRLQLMEDLCEGLHHAHQRRLVHRDIKPANLIIDRSNGRLKILDFGIVRNLEETSDSSIGMLIGTFNYMSPEQTRGSAKLDHRSDIFTVGVVFYELLSYRKAFPSGGTMHELLGRIQFGAPVPLIELCPDLEPEIDRVVRRAMEKKPEDRYQSLSQMRREIVRIRQRLEQDAPHEEEVTSLTFVGEPTQIDVPPQPEPEPVGPKVTQLLETAEQALRQQQFDAALAAAEEALDLHADDSRVGALRDRILRARTQHQIGLWLAGAREQLAAGHLTVADDLVRQVIDADPGSEDARRLKDDLRHARMERREAAERAAQRAERALALWREAQQALGARDLARALDAVRKAMVLDPGRQEMVTFEARVVAAIADEERAEQERQRKAEEARRRREEEERLARETEAQRAEARRRAELQRQREEAERQARIAHWQAEARAALERQDFDAGLAIVGEAKSSGAPANLFAELERELVARRDAALEAARRRQQFEEGLARARTALDAGDVRAARAVLFAIELIAPDDPALAQLRTRIAAFEKEAAEAAERKRRQEEEAKRLAEEERQRQAEAKRVAEEARRKAEAEAKRLAEEEERQRQAEAKRRAEEERQRQAEAKRLAEEERKRQAEAKRRADEERQQQAAAKKAAEEERQRRLEAERREAEAQQAKARRDQAAQLVEHATQILGAPETVRTEHELDQVLTVIGQARELDPESVRIDALRGEALARLRTQLQADSSNARLQALLYTHDADARRARLRRRVMAGGGATAAVLLLSAGIVALLTRTPQPTPTPATPPVVQPRPATSTTTTTVPVAPPPPVEPIDTALGTLSVDAQPWARVTITSASAQNSTTGPLVTPFSVPLSPGEYVLRLENGSLSQPLSRRVRIDAKKQNLVHVTMPGFNSERVVTELLGAAQ